MSQTTQCPSCQTKFKVSDAHLALAGGMVRCGRCSHVFHAPSHVEQTVLEAPPAPAAIAPSPVMSQPAQRIQPPPAGGLDAGQAAGMDDDFELELPDFQPAASSPGSEAKRTAPVAQPDIPIHDTDFDLPDFDLLEQQRNTSQMPTSAGPATAQESAPQIAPDFRAAAAEAEASRKEIAEFQQALADALRSPASNKKLAAYQSEPQAAEQDDGDDDLTLSATAPADTRVEPVFTAPPVATAAPADTETAGNDDDHEAPAANPGALKTTLQGLLAAVLALALIGQVAFINRTRVSAEVPELRPAFESLCASLGCSVPLPTDRQLIRTEWSELSFVPQNDHLIQLNATLKNLANYPQAYPVMELTLKDAEDKVVVRKTYRPAEYIPPNELKLGQFNANSEVKLQLRMAMLQGKALGYSLHFYYP